MSCNQGTQKIAMQEGPCTTASAKASVIESLTERLYYAEQMAMELASLVAKKRLQYFTKECHGTLADTAPKSEKEDEQLGTVELAHELITSILTNLDEVGSYVESM